MGLRSPKEIASLIAVCFSRRFPASLCPVSLRETPAASPNQASTVRILLPSAKIKTSAPQLSYRGSNTPRMFRLAAPRKWSPTCKRQTAPPLALLATCVQAIVRPTSSWAG